MSFIRLETSFILLELEQNRHCIDRNNILRYTNMKEVNNENDIENSNIGSKESDVDETVFYMIDDVPPWYMCLFLGLQHFLTMIGGTLSIPFILCPALCMQ